MTRQPNRNRGRYVKYKPSPPPPNPEGIEDKTHCPRCGGRLWHERVQMEEGYTDFHGSIRVVCVGGHCWYVWKKRKIEWKEEGPIIER